MKTIYATAFGAAILIAASNSFAQGFQEPNLQETAEFIANKLDQFGPNLKAWNIDSSYNKSMVDQTGRSTQNIVINNENRTIQINFTSRKYFRSEYKEKWSEAKHQHSYVVKIDHLSNNIKIREPVGTYGSSREHREYWGDIETQSLDQADINTMLVLECADKTRCIKNAKTETIFCHDSTASSNWCNNDRTLKSDASEISIWMRMLPAEQVTKVKSALEHLINLTKKANPPKKELF